MYVAEKMAVYEDLVGQVSGFWFDPGRPVPTSQPTYYPTGAILLPFDTSNISMPSEFVCLDLVLVPKWNEVDHCWVPLSEAGRYTYAHSMGLMHGEVWRLAIWVQSVRIYEASFAASIPSEQIAERYGPAAAIAARNDYPTVQLKMRLAK